ncbi:DUF3592 domain-containing protein [Paraburkholderia dipogonis]|uniref:DUF3592 domain-containing protein n=1 Tax=Paraburkholderia dipogonis TaxID=1211383 RepID=UPI00406BDA0E
MQSSVVVPGRVVALSAGGSHPQINFMTQEGEVISYPQEGFIYGMKVGQDVKVRYAKNRPLRSARIDAFGSIWATALAFTFIGACAILTAVSNWARKQESGNGRHEVLAKE